jgi:hypothetical protein
MPRTLAALICILTASATTAAEFKFEKHDQGMRVLLDGELFTDYLTDAGPKPYLWPIIGPTGKPMTRAFPMEKVDGEKTDHPHQRSFWFTHGDVNGVDFWLEGDKGGKIIHREFTEMSVGDTARLVSKNDWLAPDGKKLCSDERSVTFQSADGKRIIDFDITLHASEGPLTLGDTKEGAFGVRVPTSMDVEQEQGKTGGHIVNSAGQRDGDTWGKPAAWVDYHGPVEGETLGIAILNHPESFRFPTHWHVRGYGLYAANPFGLHDFTGAAPGSGKHELKAGESITLRYRVIFHAGDEEAAQIANAFAEYAESR